MGVGLGCYPLANDRYSPGLGDRDTHDTYLNLATELGLPGLLMWMGLVGSVFLYVRRLSGKKASLHPSIGTPWLQCGLVAFLVAGIFGSYSGITMGYLILGALWVGATLSGPAQMGQSNRIPRKHSSLGKR